MALGSIGFPALASGDKPFQNVFVLGADGMDPYLLGHYIQKGWMPNFARLAARGGSMPIQTTNPPQSPVAWSSFISGMNPGGHGIFDFIARDSETLTPFLSTSRTSEASKTIKLGKYAIPVSSAKTELLREGPTLWDFLQRNGVDSSAFRVPVNFPPTESKAHTLSGITTPDLHGSYGIFTFFTNSPDYVDGDIAGGQIRRIRVRDHVASCVLPGPINSFRVDKSSVDIPFDVELDSVSRQARLHLPGNKLMLRVGEWSDWITMNFTMIPLLADVSGICRFYLKSVDPWLELYVSPLNIDPMNPAMPISTPGNFSGELAEEMGNFYTQGMPEDTSALSAGVFNDDEFREQATFVLEERMRFLDHELSRFRDGFFYFYFSSLDLNSHAFWRTIDPYHPLYTEELAKRHGDFLPKLYRRIDDALGKIMERAGDNALVMAVSDHGFVPFRRQFNLNGWLMDSGFAKARNRFSRGKESYFADVDWTGTKAYGLGINSLYLNVKGREPDGTVAPGSEFEQERSTLIEKLLSIKDPETGDAVISNAWRPEEIYSGPNISRAPDILVCYNRNYRASWDTILGKYPREHLLDNLDPWSGDHCMDAQFLPGVFVCNQKSNVPDVSLVDMAPSIIRSFGLKPPSEMEGRNVFS